MLKSPVIVEDYLFILLVLSKGHTPHPPASLFHVF